MPNVLFEPEQLLIRPWGLVGRMHQAYQEARGKLGQHSERLGFVTDVDDTAFITAFRTARLFKDFVQSCEAMNSMPRDDIIQQVMELARTGKMPYLAKQLLEGKVPEKVVTAWAEYWRMNFFTNQALAPEIPQRNVKELLHLLVRRGLSVGYLTGRHLPGQASGHFPAGMVEGTLHNLWKHDFPHGPVTFKPAFEVADLAYKRDHFMCCLDPDAGGLIPVGYLDNEPGIVNVHDAEMERLGIPHLSVWVRTVYAPLPEDVRLRPGVVVLPLTA